MPNNPTIHHRRSLRLKGYDYSLPPVFNLCSLAKEELKKPYFYLIFSNKTTLVAMNYKAYHKPYFVLRTKYKYCLIERQMNKVIRFLFVVNHLAIKVVRLFNKVLNTSTLHEVRSKVFLPNRMNNNPNIHHHRSLRLKGYDYSQAGLYFVIRFKLCPINFEFYNQSINFYIFFK